MITEKEALEIMKTMDLPPERLEEPQMQDWFWLLRNIWTRNSEHPNIEEVHEVIKEKCKAYKKNGFKEV